MTQRTAQNIVTAT